jgi:hypothetical protein
MRDSRGKCGLGYREIGNRVARTRKGGLVSRWGEWRDGDRFNYLMMRPDRAPPLGPQHPFD